MSTDTAAITRLPQILEAQKRAASEQGTPSADERRARLQKMIDLLVRYHKPLTEAIDADFGGRLVAFSIMNDILGAITSLKHTRDSLESWMEDESGHRTRRTTNWARGVHPVPAQGLGRHHRHVERAAVHTAQPRWRARSVPAIARSSSRPRSCRRLRRCSPTPWQRCSIPPRSRS